VVSYDDRYGLPLLGVKALLVIWAVERVAYWPVGRKLKSTQGGTKTIMLSTR